MLDANTLILFTTTAIMLCLAPGPDNIFVLTQSMMRGGNSGLFVTLGLCTGLIFHTFAVSLGVAVIFQKSQLAFTILKLSGAAYLLYLAWGAFTSKAHGLAKNSKVKKVNGIDLYKRGVIMNITNPKVSIFFLAFLPQFTNPTNGNMQIQLIELGFIFIICTLIVFSAISKLAGKLGNWFINNPKSEIIMNRVAGSVFAALALKLAFTHR